MRRALYIIGCAVAAVAVLEWAVPDLVSALFKNNAPACHDQGEDYANKMVLSYLYCGTISFLAVGAWIGNTFASNTRRGAAMATGAVAGTLLWYALIRLAGHCSKFGDFADAPFGIFTWALLCAGTAALLARLTQQRTA